MKTWYSTLSVALMILMIPPSPGILAGNDALSVQTNRPLLNPASDESLPDWVDYRIPDGSLHLTTGFNGSRIPSSHRTSDTPDRASFFKPGAPDAQANTWDALEGGLNYDPFAIEVAGERVYAGGVTLSIPVGICRQTGSHTGMDPPGTRWMRD